MDELLAEEGGEERDESNRCVKDADVEVIQETMDMSEEGPDLGCFEISTLFDLKDRQDLCASSQIDAMSDCSVRLDSPRVIAEPQPLEPSKDHIVLDILPRACCPQQHDNMAQYSGGIRRSQYSIGI